MTWAEKLGALGAEIDSRDLEQDEQIAAQAQRIADLQDQLEQANQPPSPEPIPEPKATMPVGASLFCEPGETKQAAFERRAKDWGAAPEIVRYFFTGMPIGWPQFGAANTVVSWKPPSVAGFARGDNDAAIKAWLDSFPRDKKVRRVAVFHEREDDIEAGRFSKADARAMDSHLNELIDAANQRNGTKITFGLILMAWTLDSRSGRNYADYLPAQDAGWQYDWMGWDAYPGDSTSNDLPNLTYTKALYGRAHEAAKQAGISNVYICETGTRNTAGDSAAAYDQRQADWITGAVGIARDLGYRGFMYFDSTVGGDFRIKGPKAFAAMGAEIGK